MTAIWLPFLVGLVTGSAVVLPVTTVRTWVHPPRPGEWSVAAIAARIERERGADGRRRSGSATGSLRTHGRGPGRLARNR